MSCPRFAIKVLVIPGNKHCKSNFVVNSPCRGKRHCVCYGLSGIMYYNISSQKSHLQISILLQGKLTSYSADTFSWKICTEAILNDNINYNIYKTSFHEAFTVM